MSTKKAEIVVCGAGIMGVSAAYFLAVKNGISDIFLIDPRPPLTLTSDKSTECYRNWWPGPGDAMVTLHNRSIDLLEDFASQIGNSFHLNRRGYLYLSTEKDRVPQLQASAEEASALGAGDLRVHQAGSKSYVPHQAEGFDGPGGADLLLDRQLIQQYFPYLSDDVEAALHVRRAGWLSAQQYGAWLLDQARSAGVELLEGKVIGVSTAGGRVDAVELEDGSRIQSSAFVNAAGPLLAEVGDLLDVEVPVFNELHLKASFDDHLGVVPRDAPLLIAADPQHLPWTEEERSFLVEDSITASLAGELPAGAHTRPEGGPNSNSILVLWDVHDEPVDPEFPLPDDPFYAELAIRGLGRILPGMTDYLDKMPRPFVDGGYYTKTQENRPLAGPLPVDGAYVIGAASGYGIMASAALGELVAAHILDESLPEYSAAFELARYEDIDYRNRLRNWGGSWQL